MKYTICNTGNGKKEVKFENGLTERIIKMKGKEIFRIPNPFLTGLNKVRFPMNFEGKIKDAVLVIMNGDGDFIKNNYVFQYVDRKYGETVRLETIEKYKNAKFGYIVKFWHTGFKVKKELIKNGVEFRTGLKEVFYDSIDEAENHKKDIIKQAKTIIRKPNQLKENLERSVVTDIAHFMYNDMERRNICNSWSLEVVQQEKLA